MGTSSAGTRLTATDRRTLRKLRALLVEQFVSPVCKRIRETREQLRKEARERGDSKRARELTQEGIARAIHVTVKAYRAYEDSREPNYLRRRQISEALGLDPDFFEAYVPNREAEDLAALRGELAGMRGEIAGLQRSVDQLRRAAGQDPSS